MKVLEDGYKVIEDGDQVSDGLLAMRENLDTLHDMIVQLRGVEPVPLLLDKPVEEWLFGHKEEGRKQE